MDNGIQTPPTAQAPATPPAPPQAPAAPLSVDAFAAKIKAKYPQYQSLSNADLTSKILAKYPVYRSQVQTAPSPKIGQPPAVTKAQPPPGVAAKPPVQPKPGAPGTRLAGENAVDAEARAMQARSRNIGPPPDLSGIAAPVHLSPESKDYVAAVEGATRSAAGTVPNQPEPATRFADLRGNIKNDLVAHGNPPAVADKAASVFATAAGPIWSMTVGPTFGLADAVKDVRNAQTPFEQREAATEFFGAFAGAVAAAYMMPGVGSAMAEVLGASELFAAPELSAEETEVAGRSLQEAWLNEGRFTGAPKPGVPSKLLDRAFDVPSPNGSSAGPMRLDRGKVGESLRGMTMPGVMGHMVTHFGESPLAASLGLVGFSLGQQGVDWALSKTDLSPAQHAMLDQTTNMAAGLVGGFVGGIAGAVGDNAMRSLFGKAFPVGATEFTPPEMTTALRNGVAERLYGDGRTFEDLSDREKMRVLDGIAHVVVQNPDAVADYVDWQRKLAVKRTAQAVADAAREESENRRAAGETAAAAEQQAKKGREDSATKAMADASAQAAQEQQNANSRAQVTSDFLKSLTGADRATIENWIGADATNGWSREARNKFVAAVGQYDKTGNLGRPSVAGGWKARDARRIVRYYQSVLRGETVDKTNPAEDAHAAVLQAHKAEDLETQAQQASPAEKPKLEEQAKQVRAKQAEIAPKAPAPKAKAVPPPGTPLADLKSRPTSPGRTQGVRREPIKPLSLGAATNVLTPDGTRLPAHYAVVGVDQLRPSHSPFTYQWYADYPEAAQPRERAFDKTSQATVEEIGSHPDPTQLFAVAPRAQEGPPVILPDGVVLAGNGRAMGMALAWDRGNGAVIAGGFPEQQGRYGEVQFSDADKPVPVIVLDSDIVDDAKLRQLGRDLNIGPAGGMASAEEGRAAAGFINEAKIAEFAEQMAQMQSAKEPDESGKTEQVTLRQWMDKYSVQLGRFMVDSGMVPAGKATEFVEQRGPRVGRLTEKGKNLLEAALRGKAIGDPAVVIEAQEAATNIVDKLDRSLGLLNIIKGRGGDWDFTRFLPEALTQWVRARRNYETVSKTGDKKDSLVDRWMFPDNYREGNKPLPGMESDIPKVAVILARVMGNQASDIKEALGLYADEMAMAGDPNQPNMFGGANGPDPITTFNTTIAPLSDLDGQPKLRVTADDWKSSDKTATREAIPAAQAETQAAPAETTVAKGSRKVGPPPESREASGDTKTKMLAAMEAERAKLKASFNKLNIGFDPEILSSVVKLAYYELRIGAGDFAEWSKGMIADLGEKARPYLQMAWNNAKELIASGFTMPEEEAQGDRLGETEKAVRGAGRRKARGPDEETAPGTKPGGAVGGGEAGVSGRGVAGSRSAPRLKEQEQLAHGGKAPPRVINLAPAAPRGPAVVSDADWQARLKGTGLPVDMPAPTHRLPDDIASKLTFPGQKELGDYVASALENNGGALLATATGSGKSWIAGATIADALRKDPNARVLVVTKNRGLIEQETRGLTDTFGQFGVQLLDLDLAASPTKPGAYATTYATLVRHPELASHNFDLVVADESGNARRWWESDTGALTKTLTGNAKKALYMSATPFHTPLELAYLEKLGLWPKGQFESWVRQFGVTKKDGKWSGVVSAPMMAGFRQQMVERGVFANMELDLTGFNAHFGVVPLSGEQHVQLENIQRAFQMTEDYFRGRGQALVANRIRGLAVNFQKAWLERTRLPQVIEHVGNLRTNGWRAVVFTETKAGREDLYKPLQEADRALNGAIRKLMPPLPSTVDELKARFGDELADLTGPYDARRKRELQAFQSGDKSIAVGTYASIGEGISLDDTEGGKPVAGVYSGLPWSGMLLHQGTGRLWRYGTKSDVHATFLFSDTLPEKALMDKVTARLGSLNASITGAEKGKVLDGLRGSDAAAQEVGAYAEGAEAKLDPKEFKQITDTSNYKNWKGVTVGPAENAKHRGVEYARKSDTGPLFKRTGPPKEPFPASLFPDMPKNAMEALRAYDRFDDWAWDLLKRYPAKSRELMPYLRDIWDDLHARAGSPEIGPDGKPRTPEQVKALERARSDKAQANLFGAEPPPESGRKPSQGTLFSRWWGGPAKDAGIPEVLGKETDKGDQWRSFRTANATPVYVVDGGIGDAMLHDGIFGFTVRDEDQVDSKALEVMRGSAAGVALMERVRGDAKDGPVVVIASNDAESRDVANLLAHELHHAWQYRLERDAGDLLDRRQLLELADHAVVKKTAEQRKAAGYIERPDIAVMETAARLAAESPEALGVTPVEAGSFLDEYFTKLAERHGGDAERTLEGVLRKRFYEAYGRGVEARRAAGAAGARGGVAAWAERPPEPVSGVEEGRQSGAGEPPSGEDGAATVAFKRGASDDERAAEPNEIERGGPLKTALVWHQRESGTGVFYLSNEGRGRMADAVEKVSKTVADSIRNDKAVFVYRHILDGLNARAQHPELAAAMAGSPHGLIVVVHEGTPEQIAGARVEEEWHLFQSQVGDGIPGNAISDSAAALLVKHLETNGMTVSDFARDYFPIGTDLAKKYGAESATRWYAAEIGARLMMGRYSELGIDKEVGDAAREAYVEAVRERWGDENVNKAFADGSEAIQQGNRADAGKTLPSGGGIASEGVATERERVLPDIQRGEKGGSSGNEKGGKGPGYSPSRVAAPPPSPETGRGEPPPGSAFTGDSKRRTTATDPNEIESRPSLERDAVWHERASGRGVLYLTPDGLQRIAGKIRSMGLGNGIQFLRSTGMFVVPRFADELMAGRHDPDIAEAMAGRNGFIWVLHGGRDAGTIATDRFEEEMHAFQAEADRGYPEDALTPANAVQFTRELLTYQKQLDATWNLYRTHVMEKTREGGPEAGAKVWSAEIGAKLLARDYEGLGLTESQGDALAKRYLELVGSSMGHSRIELASRSASDEAASRLEAVAGKAGKQAPGGASRGEARLGTDETEPGRAHREPGQDRASRDAVSDDDLDERRNGGGNGPRNGPGSSTFRSTAAGVKRAAPPPSPETGREEAEIPREVPEAIEAGLRDRFEKAMQAPGKAYGRAAKTVASTIGLGTPFEKIERAGYKDVAEAFHAYRVMKLNGEHEVEGNQYAEEAEKFIKSVTPGQTKEQRDEITKAAFVMFDRQYSDNLRESDPALWQKFKDDPAISRIVNWFGQRTEPSEQTEMRRYVGGTVKAGNHITGKYLPRVPKAIQEGIAAYRGEFSPEERWAPGEVRPTPQRALNAHRYASATYYLEHADPDLHKTLAEPFARARRQFVTEDAWRKMIAHGTAIKSDPDGEMPAQVVMPDGAVLYSEKEIRRLREEADRSGTKAPDNMPTYNVVRLGKSANYLMREANRMGAAVDRDPTGERLKAMVKNFQASATQAWAVPSVVADAWDKMDVNAELSKQVAHGEAVKFGGDLVRFSKATMLFMSFGLRHAMNDTRRLVEAQVGGHANPTNYYRAAKALFFDPALKAEVKAGTAGDRYRQLLRDGGIVGDRAAALQDYQTGNARIDKVMNFGTNWLFGKEGIDKRARLYMDKMLEAAHPEMSSLDRAKLINAALGHLGRASRTDAQNMLSHFLMWPGFDLGSVQWILAHPIKTVAYPALVAAAANYTLYLAGLNKKKDRFDFTGIHFKNTTVNPALVSEWIARGLASSFEKPIEAGLRAGSAKAAWRAYSPAQTATDVGKVAEEMLVPALLVALLWEGNHAYPGQKGPMTNASDARKPGILLPTTRDTEKHILLGATAVLPGFESMLTDAIMARNRRELEREVGPGLGTYFGISSGLSNYPAPPPPKSASPSGRASWAIPPHVGSRSRALAPPR